MPKTTYQGWDFGPGNGRRWTATARRVGPRTTKASRALQRGTRAGSTHAMAASHQRLLFLETRFGGARRSYGAPTFHNKTVASAYNRIAANLNHAYMKKANRPARRRR